MVKSKGSTADNAVGSTNSQSRFAASRKSKGRISTTFESVTVEVLVSTILAVISEGDLLSFSATSDGGQLCITIINGDFKDKWYPNGAAELEEALGEIYGGYT